jgi:hypothetical protein
MEIKSHILNNTKIAEIITGEVVLSSTEEGLDLLGNLYYQGFDKIIIYKKNITPEFFSLKNGIAGDILQKFSQYRMPLAIVGDFTNHQSKSLQDFIMECNRGNQINFAASLPEALQFFTQ